MLLHVYASWRGRLRDLAVTLLVLFGLQACRETPPPATDAVAPTAQQATATATATASATTSAAPTVGSTARPFLYVVSKGEATGHLLGTMHMGGDPDEDLNAVVWKRFEAAPMVVIEADLGSVDPVSLFQQMQLPPGQKLSSKLTPKQFKALEDMLASVPPGLKVDRMKPHTAMSFLVQQMVPKTRPMDLVIQSRAKKANKKMGYLETVDAQMKLIEEAIDAEALAFSLDHLDEMNERLGEMTKAYLKGDEKALVAAVFDPEEMKEQPEMFERLFTQRNAAWVKMLPGFFEEGAFVAVGCGHLLGDDSVVSMLRKDGWKVERVVVASP